MAKKSKKKRRRPKAGPPPAPNRVEEHDAPRKRVDPRTLPPREPSFNGVFIRAALVAVLFYPYLLFIAGESSGTSALISGIAFVAMIPLGMLLDRFRYRVQSRRYEREHGGR